MDALKPAGEKPMGLGGAARSKGVRPMKVAFVSVESGITALGFRRVAAVARRIDPDTDIFFVAVDNLYSLLSHIFPTNKSGFNETDAEVVGRRLAGYDMICFSSMSASARHVEAIIAATRRDNSRGFILFGGVHAILYPEEAIAVSDAICVAEGEKPYEMLHARMSAGEDITDVPGMWFKAVDGSIRKNPSLPLNSNEALSNFSYLYNGFDCEIYDLGRKQFRPFNKFDYVRFNGLTYRTVWSIGCPFSCTFCANDAFIAYDKKYTKLRFPSPDHLITEIEDAIRLHPYISTVAFYDDNLIALPVEVIREFAKKYRERIGLPFVVFGVHPNIVVQEKFDLLAEAGMNRARMGVQSGNEKMLAFYERRTAISRIRSSVSILGKAARRYNMIPPSYDIITDNPLENRDDIVATLKFLYHLERPYTLTIFGLRVFPKTKLWKYFAMHPESGDPRGINSSYLDTRPTIGNILLYVLATGKPPAGLFNWALKFVKGYDDQQSNYFVLHFLAKNIYLSKRAFDHLVKLDFTVIVGAWTYWVWKLGLIRRPHHSP